MGYYSHFEMISSDIDNAVEVLNDLMGNTGGAPFFDTDGRSYDSTKWYDWLVDLQLVADAYPDNFMVVERCGEESPDISRAVVKNGTVIEVVPTLVWPEY